MTEADSNPKTPKYNTLRVLAYFQSKFFKTYQKVYTVNPGKDITVMKRVKTLFENNTAQLGDLMVFIDVCFDQNKNNPIGTPYLLKATNIKLGFFKGQHKPKVKKDTPPMTKEVEDFIKSEQQMWNNRLSQ